MESRSPALGRITDLLFLIRSPFPYPVKTLSMKKLLAMLLVPAALLSCTTQQKIRDARKTVRTFNALQQQERKDLDSLTAFAVTRYRTRSIDSATSNSLNRSFGKLKGRLDMASANAVVIENVLGSRRRFRKEYMKEIRPRLLELDTFNASAGKREQVYQMFTDALNMATYNLFSLAAFFDPGVYQIPANSFDKVKMLFDPVVDTVAAFSNRYNGINHTASIVLIGYADAAMITDSSDLHMTLKRMLRQESPSRQELNRQLSQLRAQELLRQLKFLVMQKASCFNNYKQLRMSYLAIGKGEELPLPYIADYRDYDERRRIVLCYWSVFPEL